MLQQIIILIHDDYPAGGNQRSAMAVHGGLTARGYRTTIYCARLVPGGLAARHAFVRGVAPMHHPSKLVRWAGFFLSLRRLLRREKPVAAIGLGLFASIALPVAGAGLRTTRFIGSERTYPPAAAAETGRLLRILRRLVFPRLDYVVCQTERSASWFRRSLAIADARNVVIPNAVASPPPGWPVTRYSEIGRFVPTFLAVGRLAEEKGFDDALRIFAIVVQSCPRSRLIILGDGPDYAKLLKLRAELQLEDHVEFRPPVPSLEDFWRDAYALLFTSHYEGFPNVLAEAMVHGVPAVAFDAPAGPSELITNGENGFLVTLGDVETAAQRMLTLIADPALRDELGREAMTIANRYDPQRIAKAWAELIESGAKA